MTNEQAAKEWAEALHRFAQPNTEKTFLAGCKHVDKNTSRLAYYRQQHNLVGTVYANASGYLFEIHHTPKLGGSHQYDSGYEGPNDSGCWDAYEEAESALIIKLEELIKQQKGY